MDHWISSHHIDCKPQSISPSKGRTITEAVSPTTNVIDLEGEYSNYDDDIDIYISGDSVDDISAAVVSEEAVLNPSLEEQRKSLR
jgi:hypothetical protein